MSNFLLFVLVFAIKEKRLVHSKHGMCAWNAAKELCETHEVYFIC